MSRSSQLTQTLTALAGYRQIAFRIAFEGIEDESDLDAVSAFGDELNDVVTALEILARHAGLSVSRLALLNFNERRSGPRQLTEFYNRPVGYPLRSLWEDELADPIRENHGQLGIFAYHRAKEIAVTYSVAAFFCRLEKPLEDQRKDVRDEIMLALESLPVLGQGLWEDSELLTELLGDGTEHDLLQLRDAVSEPAPTGDFFERVRAAGEPLVNRLVPRYSDISANLQRAREIRDELRSVPKGATAWRSYETACIKACWFLFVPPQRRVIAQSRSGTGSRRDAIIPNTADAGFWRALRDDYECRYIVVEFKNTIERRGDPIRQMRIYLDRPTIGRFGLLFVRDKPAEALRAAQRAAYEDRRHLVLMIDDAALERLLIARAVLDDVAPALEDERIEFEVAY